MSNSKAMKLVTPVTTLPNMMPTSGTITTSLNWMRWMNHTNTQVPRMAVTNAKRLRPQMPAPGTNTMAMSTPSWADWMVAPVVGDTNLFMQSCCMMRPATLMPAPVHSTASRRGRREASRVSHWSASPAARPEKSMSSTPMNSDAPESPARSRAKMTVDR